MEMVPAPTEGWHAPGLGEVHSADHGLMIFCTQANPDADARPDYLPDDELARLVAALLNAGRRACGSTKGVVMDDRTLLERDEAQLCKACNVWVRPGDDCIPKPEGCIVAVGEVASLTCAANHYCPTHNPAPAAASLAEGEAK